MAQAVEDALLVRMEASLRKFERQMEAGRKAAEGSAVKSERAWKKAGDQIAANANRATSGLNRLAQIGGRGTFVLQNTANQIGDMAVQIGGGTSAAKAMGQQLPQLFGGFAALGGPLGLIAPLLGTVAAIGLPVAAALIDIGDAAETLDDKMKALKESISAVKSAQDLSATSATDLLSSYGSLADEAQAIFEINRQIASIKAGGALDSAARGIAGELGVAGVFGFGPNEIRDLEGTIDALKKELIDLNDTSLEIDGLDAWKAASDRIDEVSQALKDLEEASDNLDDLGDALGISDAAARDVVAQFAAIGQAEGPKAQAQAMLDLADYIHDASNNLAKAEDEGKALYDRILEAAMQALEMSKYDLASNISAGADAAREFSQELWDAVSAKNALEGKGASGGRGGDPRQFENDPYWRSQYFPEPEKGTRKGGRSRNGGGGSGATAGLREADQLFDRTRTKAERYAEELKRIEELHRKFPQVVTAEVRDRAVEALNDAANAAEGMGKRMESSFASAFSALVAGAGSGREAVQALIADLARMAAQSAWTSLMGDAGGGFFTNAAKFLFGGANANGNVFQGGRVTAFADGGVVGAPTYFPMAGGKTGLMGEAGPEAIMPLARVNGKLGVRTVGAQQSGGHVTIALTLSDDLDARIDNRAQNVSVTTVREYDRSALPGRVGQIIRDPRKKN
jgi:hypothetical protein